MPQSLSLALISTRDFWLVEKSEKNDFSRLIGCRRRGDAIGRDGVKSRQQLVTTAKEKKRKRQRRRRKGKKIEKEEELSYSRPHQGRARTFADDDIGNRFLHRLVVVLFSNFANFCTRKPVGWFTIIKHGGCFIFGQKFHQTLVQSIDLLIDLCKSNVNITC